MKKSVSIKKGSSGIDIYNTLRQEILTLRLEPGSPIDEFSLTKRFKVSRSPVREAIVRLAGEGLTIVTKNRRNLVAPIDVSNFPKYIEALDVIQRIVTRLAAQLRKEDDLNRIRECMEDFEKSVSPPDDYLIMSETNKGFHLAISDAGKNPYLSQCYKRLLDEGQRMLHIHFDYLMHSESESLLIEEHVKMFEAIRDQDIKLAEKLAHEHTRQFRDRFLSFLQQNYASDIDFDASL